MIDTVKIYTEIDIDIYRAIYNQSIIKTSYKNSTNEVFYEIVNDHLEGSYSSSLSVKVGCGSKYGFVNKGYFIEIEGSYHKIIRGYNSHNGFYDLSFVCKELISIVEYSYNIKLPDFEFWFLQRCDISIVFDLKNNDNVKSYINSLSRCNYPRRKMKHYADESIYLSGTTTTLKIYNKYLEFKKHDLKKFIGTDFDLEKYFEEIQGFVRFECEIKKKVLKDLFKSKNVKIIDVNYDILRNVWSDEFMKILKFVDNELKVVRNREDVKNRLNTLYKKDKANRLYNFYCAIQLNGLEDIKNNTSKSCYYRYIKDLKNASVDFSQTYKIVEDNNIFFFNPFESREVA